MNNRAYEFARNSYIEIRRRVRHSKNKLLDRKPKLAVLLYHRILPDFIPDPLRITVGLDTFIRQIQTLARHYPLISLKDAIAQCQNNSAKADIQVVLTFDDGYRGQYEFAYPYLKKKGLPATIFLPTDFIAGPNHNDYITWEQAGEMNRSGIEIGSHGLSHASLAKIPLSEARNEIKRSREIIEETLKKPCDYFAFPYGARNDYNRALIDCVKEVGFKSCMLNVHGYNHINKDAFCFKRIIMEEATNVEHILG